MSKLKNIQALSEMLSGNHKSQTKTSVSMNPGNPLNHENKTKIHEIGDIWPEYDWEGKIVRWWQQHKGWRSSSSRHPDEMKEIQELRDSMNSFRNCPKGECTCKSPSRLDKKFRVTQGICFDCVIEKETSLKIQGKFNDYAIDKMKANAESFFKDADAEVEVLKREALNINFAGDVNDPDNPVETWSFQNPESFIKHIDEQYQSFKEKTLEELEKKRG